MGIEYDIFGTGMKLKTGIDFDRFTSFQGEICGTVRELVTWECKEHGVKS